MNIYVPGKGHDKPKICFVGEAPAGEEEKELTPFVGPSGRFLNLLLSEAGIDRNANWMTNVLKYSIPPNPKKGKKRPFQVRARSVGIDVEKSITELRLEIDQLNPNIIVPLGGSALWAITGKKSIQDYRGSILQGFGGRKIVATYHPAHILHQEGDVKGYWNKTVMAFDLKRAKIESLTNTIDLPQRTLNICESSYQFHDFINRYKDYRYPSIDIEAMDCIPICIGIAFTKNEGITIPLWNVRDISNISDSELNNIWNLLSLFLARHNVIGQNFGYDRDKIKRLGLIIKGLHSDTMLKAFAINPELPKNLAFNTSIYTREPFYKNEGMYEGSLHDLFIGCARDACVTKEVDEAMDADLNEIGTRSLYENFLLPLHDLYAYIEGEGLRVDRNAQEHLLKKYVEWNETISYQLYKIAGWPINFSSWQQVSKLLFEQFKLPERKGTGEEELTQLLNSKALEKKPLYAKAIELILEGRRVKKTIGTYILALPDFDGRMRTSYFICLETGRSSSNQQEAPIRPSVEYKDEKNVKKKQARGIAFQTITKHGDIGSDYRTIFTADEGEIFLQVDSSQAEARVIFLLAEDYQALQDIDTHDYHALTASWFFGGIESDYSKKVLGYESPIRFAGKTLRHAGHLGASKRRAATEVNTQARKYKIDFKLSESEADKALKIFHAKQPKIKNVFQASVIRCIDKDRRLTAPVPHGIDADKGGTRTFYERYGDELFRQAFSYLPQRTVSENTKASAMRIRLHANWIRILLESHDSLLVSVPISRKYEAATILKTEFERPINFAKCSIQRGELIIPAEIEECFNYKDLSKFKYLVPENV